MLAIAPGHGDDIVSMPYYGLQSAGMVCGRRVGRQRRRLSLSAMHGMSVGAFGQAEKRQRAWNRGGE
jgi:hypothetical protein